MHHRSILIGYLECNEKIRCLLSTMFLKIQIYVPYCIVAEFNPDRYWYTK